MGTPTGVPPDPVEERRPRRPLREPVLMDTEPAELQQAIAQVRAAQAGGWEPTEADQRALGEVLWTLSSYVDLSGEFNAYCYEIWQHGLEVMTDVRIIQRSVREVFD